MKDVRGRVKIDFIEKKETKKMIRRHSQLTFDGIHNF